MGDHIYDVCVIGAGIIGSSAAFSLTKHTKNVVLCDQVGFDCGVGCPFGILFIISRIETIAFMSCALDLLNKVMGMTGCGTLVILITRLSSASLQSLAHFTKIFGVV